MVIELPEPFDPSEIGLATTIRVRFTVDMRVEQRIRFRFIRFNHPGRLAEAGLRPEPLLCYNYSITTTHHAAQRLCSTSRSSITLRVTLFSIFGQQNETQLIDTFICTFESSGI